MDANVTFRSTTFQNANRILANPPVDEDLLGAITRICAEASLQTALFSVVGTVRSSTVGVYDPSQEVYVMMKHESPLEIVSCAGRFQMSPDGPVIVAHAVLVDLHGAVVAGRLFTGTIAAAADVEIQPLTRLERRTAGAAEWLPADPLAKYRG